MREFIITDGCRNNVITAYLNGPEHHKTCIELGSQLCGFRSRAHIDSLSKKGSWSRAKRRLLRKRS